MGKIDHSAVEANSCGCNKPGKVQSITPQPCEKATIKQDQYFKVNNLFNELKSEWQRTEARLNLGVTDILSIEQIKVGEGSEDSNIWEMVLTKNGNKFVKDFIVRNGKDGKAPTITVGEVVSLESHEKPIVINTGDENNIVLKFGIPKGNTGREGKNAYEIYKDNGGTLELENWLNSLKGKDGRDGQMPNLGINSDGYWTINGEATGVSAKGIPGDKGERGEPGRTPTISINSAGYWVIDGRTTDVLARGKNGVNGHTPTIEIDPDTYEWIINDEGTGVFAQGASMDMSEYTKTEELPLLIESAIVKLGAVSGQTVSDPRVDTLIDDVTVLNERADVLEDQVVISDSTISVPLGMGTFQQAFNYAGQPENSNILFPWILDDFDDDGDRVRKVIYHVLNRQFIDALGSDIVGKLDGFTIVTKEACSIKINGSTVNLLKGMNNIASLSNHAKILWEGNESKILSLDFGGSKQYAGAYELAGNVTKECPLSPLNNLRSVRRFGVDGGGNKALNQAFRNNKSILRVEIIGGTALAPISGISCTQTFNGCSNLKDIDLSKAFIKPNSITMMFSGCGANVYDLRNLNLTALANNSGSVFTNSNIDTLIVGDDFVPPKDCDGWWTGTQRDFTLVIIHNGVIKNQNTHSSYGNRVLWMWRHNSDKTSWSFMFKTVKVPAGMAADYAQRWSIPSDVDIIEYESGEY